jgi:hypothetical protein
MYILLKKTIKILSVALSTTYFTYLYLVSFFEGGRWVLNQQIAFAQRLHEGISSYANGQTDLFFPSSPYFPGVGLLSYLYSGIGIGNIYLNKLFMLGTAVTIGVIYFIQLQKLTLKIYPHLSKTFVLTIITILFATHFKSYISYMFEFKPDTILLVIGLILLFLIEKEVKPNLKTLFVVGLLLFISVFFKQTFFIIYFLVFILIFFNSFLSAKEKIITLLSYSVIGLLALTIIFSIDNLYYFTVKVMSQHLMYDIKAILFIFGKSFIYNLIFCSSLLYFFYKRYFKFSLQSLETKYFIFAFAWFVFASLSAAKTGGQRGNVEVGFIVFIPFVIYAFNEILKTFYNKWYYNFFIITVLAIGISAYSFKIITHTSLLANKLNEDYESIEFLSQEFKNKNVFVDDLTYIVAKASGLKIITDYDTVFFLNQIPNYDLSKLKNAINNNAYDLFFVTTNPCSYKDTKICKIEDSFINYSNINLPIHLEGKLLLQKKEK